MSYAIASIGFGFAGLVVIQFTLGLIGLWQRTGTGSRAREMEKEYLEGLDCPVDLGFVSDESGAVYTAEDHALVEAMWVQRFCRTVVSDAVIPFRRPTAAASIIREGLEVLTVPELRGLCTARGIRWNRANNGKHLNRAQMIERLVQVNAA